VYQGLETIQEYGQVHQTFLLWSWDSRNCQQKIGSIKTYKLGQQMQASCCWSYQVQ